MNDSSKRLIRSPAWKNPRDVIKKGIRRSRRGLSVSSSSSSSSLKQLSIDNEADEGFSVMKDSQKGLSQETDSIIRNPSRRLSCKRSYSRKPIPEKINGNNNSVSSTVVDLIEDSNALQEFPSSVFNTMKKISVSEETKSKSSTTSGSNTTTSTGSFPLDFSSIDELCCSTPKKKALNPEEARTKVDLLPLDLRLGLKLRLESPKRFFWLEKSKGLAAYDDAVKLFCSLQAEINEIALETNGSLISDFSKFLACTLYWQFPDLAWQPSFPRLDNESRLTDIRNPAIPSLHTLGDPLVQALTMQWFLSFEQLYHSWRFGKLQYFYACCPAYTVLFWKTSKGTVEVNGNSSRNGEKYNFKVVITPTSYGFRQQLREDGIKYSMPFRHSRHLSRHSILNDNSLSDTTESQPLLISDDSKEQSWISSNSLLFAKRDDFVSLWDLKENQIEGDGRKKKEKIEIRSESPDDLNSSNDTDNDEWLRGIGISPRKTLKIKRNKSVMSNHSLEYERSLSLDPDFMDENRKSAIVINDLDSIAAFYNMMTTSNFGRVATGPQAGFPPTLLARQPFLNATLKNLKCQYREFTKNGADFYVCEWENGPIMPHMLIMLEHFLRQSSKSDEEISITGQISGRIKCSGMNDAAGLSEMTNFSSFEFRLGSFFKS